VDGYQLLALRNIIGCGLVLVVGGLIELGLVSWLLLQRNTDDDKIIPGIIAAVLLAVGLFAAMVVLSTSLIAFNYPSQLALVKLLGLR
jgi:uncharacterized membrane protein YidH (DUF202 family)